MIWWDRQLNVFHGCTRVSPECAHCWAVREARRWSDSPQLSAAVRNRWAGTLNANRSDWSGRINCDGDAIGRCLARRMPTTWFVNANSDTFHESAPLACIDRIFAMMALAQQHTFILCTKRTHVAAHYIQSRQAAPLPNVWLLFTAGLQETYDKRWRELAPVAALGWKVGLSAEPLLGPMNLGTDVAHRIGCVVAGGESGPKARPCNPHWARALRDQCAAASIPFTWKQWGNKSAGHLLDGRTHFSVPWRVQKHDATDA